MPPSYGVGFSARFTDDLTISLDVYRTEWQKYYLRQADGREVCLFTGQDKAQCDTQPTHQVRLGGEYVFLTANRYNMPVRVGLFYDPEPTANSPDDFWGISLGAGIGKAVVDQDDSNLVFDVAYIFRTGNNVRNVRLGTEVVGQDIRQHLIYLSLIYRF